MIFDEENKMILNEGATKLLLDVINSLVDHLKEINQFENYKKKILSPTKEFYEDVFKIAEDLK